MAPTMTGFFIKYQKNYILKQFSLCFLRVAVRYVDTTQCVLKSAFLELKTMERGTRENVVKELESRIPCYLSLLKGLSVLNKVSVFFVCCIM